MDVGQASCRRGLLPSLLQQGSEIEAAAMLGVLMESGGCTERIVNRTSAARGRIKPEEKVVG
jgi:hypothetical protein